MVSGQRLRRRRPNGQPETSTDIILAIAGVQERDGEAGPRTDKPSWRIVVFAGVENTQSLGMKSTPAHSIER